MEIQPISFINSDHACRVCQQPSDSLWTGTLIGHSVDYFECPSCGYVQTEAPYWLEQAYSSAINDSDTGIMKRNLYNRRVILGALHLLGETSSAVLDYAGGYGILVRLLRDDGVDAFWYDKFCQNLLQQGFYKICQTKMHQLHHLLAGELKSHSHQRNPEPHSLFRLASTMHPI